jgi:hypothetical protein
MTGIKAKTRRATRFLTGLASIFLRVVFSKRFKTMNKTPCPMTRMKNTIQVVVKPADG